MSRGRRQISAIEAERRAERRRVWVGVAVLTVAAVIAFISTIAINGVPWSDPYRVEAVVPKGAPLVRPGDEVRVAGQRVGEVRSASASPEGRRVELELSDGEVGPGAKATVRLRGLAGAVFIDLDRGNTESPLPSGAEIGRAQTATTTQLTDVIDAFDDETRKAFGRTLSVGGAGMAGRGEGLNRAFARLPRALEQGAPLARALRPHPGALEALVRNAATTAGALGEESGAVAGAIFGARQVVGAAAAEADSVAGAIESAPGALDELHAATPGATALLDQAERTVDALGALTGELERSIPTIDSLLGRTRGLEATERLADAAEPVLAVANPLLRGAEPAALTVGPLVRAAEPLAAYVSQYPEDVLAGPHGFTTWGRFTYDLGQAPGARAVRFTPVFTCAPGRNPYPEPGRAGEDREPCFP